MRTVGSDGKKEPAKHGGGVRGEDLFTRSSLFEGRFGRMFRSLPPAEWEDSALMELGKKMTSDPERDDKDPTLPSAAQEDSEKRLHDAEENSRIAAGYTYLGQFIDHDITFDPASSLQQRNDPEALVDYRTPRLDLDSLYGRGPADQPYMYLGKKFRLGRALRELDQPTHAKDLPRFNDPNDLAGFKRALIGDKRNDENVIISQLHAVMLQFHNKLVDANPGASFEDIQRKVRWHYQWIVVNDFLVTLCGQPIVDEILPHLKSGEPIWRDKPNLAFFEWKNEPYMPIEFSAAAYRFGHSMVRPVYRLNTRLNGGDNPDRATPDEERRGIAGRLFIFAGVHERGLNGFDEFPDRWAIDWSLFFDIDGSIRRLGNKRLQPAYKIDTSLVNPLGFLPEFSESSLSEPPLTIAKLQAKPIDPLSDPANLAQRNLFRGRSMGLPSGQDVAHAMGIEPIADENLRVGKAVVEDWDKCPPLVSIDGSFKAKAPLWFYILAEAHFEWIQRAKEGADNEAPMILGTVGGRLIAETLIGLLLGDGHSYLRQRPNWDPGQIQSMGDLIKFTLG